MALNLFLVEGSWFTPPSIVILYILSFVLVDFPPQYRPQDFCHFLADDFWRDYWLLLNVIIILFILACYSVGYCSHFESVFLNFFFLMYVFLSFLIIVSFPSVSVDCLQGLRDSLVLCSCWALNSVPFIVTLIIVLINPPEKWISVLLHLYLFLLHIQYHKIVNVHNVYNSVWPVTRHLFLHVLSLTKIWLSVSESFHNL